MVIRNIFQAYLHLNFRLQKKETLFMLIFIFVSAVTLDYVIKTDVLRILQKINTDVFPKISKN